MEQLEVLHEALDFQRQEQENKIRELQNTIKKLENNLEKKKPINAIKRFFTRLNKSINKRLTYFKNV